MPFLEILDDLAVREFGSRGVEVHARDLRAREKKREFILYLFRTKTYELQPVITAGRAFLRGRNFVAAIMTAQLVPALVIGERYIAVHALRRPPAGLAAQHGRKPSPVLEKYGLLLLFERCLHMIEQ